MYVCMCIVHARLYFYEDITYRQCPQLHPILHQAQVYHTVCSCGGFEDLLPQEFYQYKYLIQQYIIVHHIRILHDFVVRKIANRSFLGSHINTLSSQSFQSFPSYGGKKAMFIQFIMRYKWKKNHQTNGKSSTKFYKEWRSCC